MTMTKPVMGSEAPALPALAGARRIALVAGGGSLPVEAAERLACAGHRPFVVIIEGEAAEADFSGFASATLRLE
jgi:UDP-2,3-diacylglucosamine hydrolase